MRKFGAPHEPRWWPWKPRGTLTDSQSGRDESDALVADCEAFLLGKYVELLEARSEPVPVWAWTNVLAHGCQDDIVWAAAGSRGGWSSTRRWRTARAFLAGELLDAVGHGASLMDIQRQVLTPLELELASLRGVWAWTPQRWLETVRAALHSYRSSNRA